MIARLLDAYRIMRSELGLGLRPIGTGILFLTLRLVVGLGSLLDPWFFPALRRTRVRRPIVLVGNPRTGTTFLQRFLADQGVGAGLELWRMLYPSLTVQAMIRPVLPILERLSPGATTRRRLTKPVSHPSRPTTCRSCFGSSTECFSTAWCSRST